MLLRRIWECIYTIYMVFRISLINGKVCKQCIERKIMHGPNKQQYIMLIKPRENIKEKGVIFFVNGGGWRVGNASLFRFVGGFFASKGYISIIGGYRLAPKFVFPSQIEDVFNSLKLGMDVLKKDGFKVESIIPIGFSSGAHLVTFLMNENLMKEYSINIKKIKAMICISGPLNFSVCRSKYIKKVIKDFVSAKEKIKEADPYKNLNENRLIPVLCMHGDRDSFVKTDNSITFVQKINCLKSQMADLVMLRGFIHIEMLKLFLEESSYSLYMVNWIDKHFNKEFK